ncbi:MAG: DUF4173 domain-containing protein [Oscillospiraceae bacterium]
MDEKTAVSQNSSPLLTEPILPKEPIAKAQKYAYDGKDALFAVLFYLLGYGFIRWFSQLVSYGAATTIYVFAYVAAVYFYLRAKGKAVPKESRFWLLLLLLTAISYSLWENSVFAGFKLLFLLCVTVYWTLYAADALAYGKTSAAFILDGARGFFMYPFMGFGHLFNAIMAWLRPKCRMSQGKGKSIIAALCGGGITLILLGIILPQLSAADAQFARITRELIKLIPNIFASVHLFQMLLALPVAFYLFGLLFSAAHSKKANTESIEKQASAVKILPNITIAISLISIAIVYILFISLQAGNMFSAFFGKTYGGASFSEYARSGFFNLCGVAALNAAIIISAASTAKIKWDNNALLRVLSTIISLLTILLIFTSASKMLLYIGEYGLTVKRFTTLAFLGFLLVFFALIIARGQKSFSVARVSLCVFSAGFAILLCINVGGIITGYNADKYLNGSIKDYGIDVFWQTGYDGIAAARQINKANKNNKDEEILSFVNYYNSLSSRQNHWRDFNLSKAMAKK